MGSIRAAEVWSDPDMMIVGDVSCGAGLHPTRLTPDEQYSHVSMFCLLSAPLLPGCPLDRLDRFTLGLLTNDEVIAVDQDPLGQQARMALQSHGIQVWLKLLADGSYAAGLFNTGGCGDNPASYFRWDAEPDVEFELPFAAAGLATGPWTIRDLWRQRDLGVFDKAVTTRVRHHGVILLKLTPRSSSASARTR